MTPSLPSNNRPPPPASAAAPDPPLAASDPGDSVANPTCSANPAADATDAVNAAADAANAADATDAANAADATDAANAADATDAANPADATDAANTADATDTTNPADATDTLNTAEWTPAPIVPLPPPPPVPPEALKPWYYQSWFIVPTFVWWPCSAILFIRSPWHNGVVSGALSWAWLIIGGGWIFLRVQLRLREGASLLDDPTLFALAAPGVLLTIITQSLWLLRDRPRIRRLRAAGRFADYEPTPDAANAPHQPQEPPTRRRRPNRGRARSRRRRR